MKLWRYFVKVSCDNVILSPVIFVLVAATRFRVHPRSQNAPSWRHRPPAPFPPRLLPQQRFVLPGLTDRQRHNTRAHCPTGRLSLTSAACSLVFCPDREPSGTVVTVETLWCHKSVRSRVFVSPPPACLRVCVCAREPLWPLENGD